MAMHIETSAGERFGQVVRTRSAGDFLFRLSRYEPALAIPTHCHPSAYFCFVVRGGIDERCGREGRRFAAGSVHFHPVGEPHDGRMSPNGMVSLSIVPGGATAARIGSRVPRGPLQAPRLAAIAGHCLDELREDDDAADLLLEARGLELVACFLRDTQGLRGSKSPRWLADVREHLHAAYTGNVGLRDLAAIAGVHEVYLVRAFRRHLGATPGAYLRRVRVDAACAALSSTARPIAEIALAVGFSSQAHLTRVFGAALGLSPGAYRRRFGRRGH